MTDRLYDTTQISRRKVLAGLGTIGVAAAGAGLGTSAFFSDEERYANNVLTAGGLDLTVDWEEHYSDWSNDEVANGVEFRMSDPDDDANDTNSYTPFPAGAATPTVWVRDDDGDGTTRSSLEKFMDNTTLESYPDSDNDRVQDDLERYVPCDDFAQLDENLNPETGRGQGVRSANRDTIVNYDAYLEGADAQPAPLVNLHDVKPGDFGELTLSMHLCDNPGYIWLQGDLVSAAENGHTEPEASDPHEVGGPNTQNTDGTDVELLDEIMTMLWYDEDGDNVYEPAGESGDVDVVLVIDNSGSMGSADPTSGSKLANAKAGARFFVDAVGGNTQIGVVSFDTNADQELQLTPVSGNESQIKNAIDSIPSGNATNIEDGIETGQGTLTGVGARPGASQIMILLSDGEPTAGTATDGNQSPIEEATTVKVAGTDIFTIGYGISSGSSFAQTLADVASDPDDQYAYLDVDVDTPQEVEAVFGQIGQIIAGEECFFRGSLRTLLELTSTDDGVPLDGIRSTEYAEVTGDDTDSDGIVDANHALANYVDENRDPFVDCTTNAVGLSWWLPVNHANEIQTDSVTFDLGFYTEQARHNDGSGSTTPVPSN